MSIVAVPTARGTAAQATEVRGIRALSSTVTRRLSAPGGARRASVIAAMTEAELEKAVEQARVVAPCRRTKDPDAWFPGLGDHPSSDEAFTREQKRARALCAGCPVTAECLQLSLLVEQGEYGVWGAHSEWERRPMRIELARQRFAATRSAGDPVEAPRELAVA